MGILGVGRADDDARENELPLGVSEISDDWKCVKLSGGQVSLTCILKPFAK